MGDRRGVKPTNYSVMLVLVNANNVWRVSGPEILARTHGVWSCATRAANLTPIAFCGGHRQPRNFAK